VSDFFYRRRRGSDAGELINGLIREGRSADGPGPAPPGDGDGAAGRTSDDAPRPLTNAEVSVLISVGNTLARRDRRTGRAFARRQKAVIAAAHASLDATAELELAALAEPRWVNGGAGEGEDEDTAGGGPRRRGKQAFKEMFDPHEPLITGRTLLIIELVFVFVEFAFWYGVFSANLDQGASLLDPNRISDILLAVMVPLSGIVSARVVGGLTHRAITRHRGVGRKEYIGAAAAAVVAGLSVFAIFSLVSARFDSATQLTATQLPTLAMTLVFVVVLLGDMVARIFLVSEIRSQTNAWHRRLRKLRAVAMRASQRHCAAWLDLRSAAQMELDSCERIVSAGARIISDQRSRRGAVAPRVPAGSGTARRRAHEEPAARRGAPMAVPSVLPLQLYDVHLALGPVRAVEDAINTLREWPPRSQGDLSGQLNEALTRLYRLEAAMTVGPPGAGAGTGGETRDLTAGFKTLPIAPAGPSPRPVEGLNGVGLSQRREEDQDDGDQL
jgi:hypothetical protein